MAVISSSFRARVRSSIEDPVARFFGRLGFSPNALTLIGFGIACVAAWLAARQSWLLAGAVIAFGALFDLFDGALARATGKASRYGAFLDSTLDRAGEAVVYMGIVAGLVLAQQAVTVSMRGGSLVLSDFGPVVGILAMAASFMVSYSRAKSESLGFSSGTGMANVGLAPREVRVAILVVGLVLAQLIAPTRPDPTVGPIGSWLVVVATLGLIAILATITTIQRMYFVYQQSRSEPKQGKENL